MCNKLLNSIKKEKNNNYPHIDHNHKTNEIRGILCHNCNVAVGTFFENVIIINNAVKYLQFINISNSSGVILYLVQRNLCPVQVLQFDVVCFLPFLEKQ